MLSTVGVGLVSGLLAGLLGVGGGLVIVPALTAIYLQQPELAGHATHLALGTSMAVIVITALSSGASHHRHGHVDWAALERLAGPLALGAATGAVAATQLPAPLLQALFALFAIHTAARLWRAPDIQHRPGTPDRLADALIGAAIGVLSSWVGIGGGSLLVPWLHSRGHELKRAIGTSAMLGAPLAVGALLGYLIVPSGAAVAGLFGHVDLLRALPMALCAALMAPVGARLAQRVPVLYLRRAFAAFLGLTAILIGARAATSLIAQA